MVLRRLDGTVVARFSVLGTTLEDIEKAVEQTLANSNRSVPSSVSTARKDSPQLLHS